MRNEKKRGERGREREHTTCPSREDVLLPRGVFLSGRLSLSAPGRRHILADYARVTLLRVYGLEKKKSRPRPRAGERESFIWGRLVARQDTNIGAARSMYMFARTLIYVSVCVLCVCVLCVCVCVCEGDERFRNAMARLKGDFVCKKPSMKYVCARRRRHTIGGITCFVAAVTANDRCVFAFNPSIWRVLCIHSRLDCSDLTIRGND